MDTNKKITLRDFAEKYGCRYGFATEMFRKLRSSNELIARHISKEGAYQLDEVAERIMRDELDNVRGKSKWSDEERAEFEANLDKLFELTEKCKCLEKQSSRSIAKANFLSLITLFLSTDEFYDSLYDGLGREYEEDDELKFLDYLIEESWGFAEDMKNNEQEEM